MSLSPRQGGVGIPIQKGVAWAPLDRIGWSPVVDPETLLMLTRTARLTAIVVLSLLPAGAAFGFHDGGSGTCDYCHITHNSQDGLTVRSGSDGQALLRAESPSDLCLACHAGAPGQVLGSDALAPPPEKGAGNFVFLYEDNLNDAPESPGMVVPGDAAGHNILAPGHGLVSDSRFISAPGGSYPASELACTSCHDPHGNSNFRFLLDVGQDAGTSFTFRDAAPRAEGISVEGGEMEDKGLHSAYLAGMSRWCGNCHGRYHERGESAFQHPVDRPMGNAEIQRYNSYEGDGSLSGGSVATAYLPEVPFEDASSTVTSRQGPSASSRIMCLSCHRAHATSAPAAGRWDFNVELLSEDGVPSASYPIPNPYRVPRQRSLCRKCHRPQREGESTGPSGSLLDE